MNSFERLPKERKQERKKDDESLLCSVRTNEEMPNLHHRMKECNLIISIISYNRILLVVRVDVALVYILI